MFLALTLNLKEVPGLMPDVKVKVVEVKSDRYPTRFSYTPPVP
jgi:hypothetical protein